MCYIPIYFHTSKPRTKTYRQKKNSKLEYKTEHSFCFDAGYQIHHHLRRDYYSLSKIIFIGDSMKIFNGILRDKRKSTEKIIKMNDYDDSVMFLDKSHYEVGQADAKKVRIVSLKQ